MLSQSVDVRQFIQSRASPCIAAMKSASFSPSTTPSISANSSNRTMKFHAKIVFVDGHFLLSVDDADFLLYITERNI